MVANGTVEGLHTSFFSPSSTASISSSSVTSASSLDSSSSLFPTTIEPNKLERHHELTQKSVASIYPTHFQTFSNKEDCQIITETAAALERSGFYWGPLDVEDAHRMLKDAPLGSFLIRDSRQRNVFFTLSYHSKKGPLSVRIDYKHQKFSLAGNERTFPSLFALLEHYVNTPKKSLSVPYRKWEPTLQELCRKRILQLCGGRNLISELPLTLVGQDFLMEFPYKL